ncbi:MAG TPA: hypothetical protein VHZ03_27645 [Trebonia sp.]|nr:hypothetical protein [Trebonia sp.]
MSDPAAAVTPADEHTPPGWPFVILRITAVMTFAAEQPTQAFTPPAELNPGELAWFLETKDHLRKRPVSCEFSC